MENGLVTVQLHWSESMSVGHALLDEQHQRLLAICVAAERLAREPKAEAIAKFQVLLHHLADFAKLHFETEEQILTAAAYPELRAHQADHQRYIDYLERLASKTFSASEIEKTKNSLIKWWITHILRSDMEYKEHLRRAF